MATAPQTKRVNQSVKTETKDTAVINGWNLLFTYKSTGNEKPNEFIVTGSRSDLQGSLNISTGTGVDTIQFMAGALYDKELLDAIMAEIDIIKS